MQDLCADARFSKRHLGVGTNEKETLGSLALVVCGIQVGQALSWFRGIVYKGFSVLVELSRQWLKDIPCALVVI